MDSIRTSARRRGLRAAAQVAAVGGLLAASAALGHAEPARAEVRAGGDGASETASSDGSGASVADRVAEAVRVRNAGNCGCAPCWGPPAPPAMRAELFDEEAAS